MTASPTTLLAFYALAIAISSIIGGLLPNWLRMTHTRTQLVMSFVSGFLLAIAVYHLVPHSLIFVGTPDAADVVAWWLMLGLVGMFLLLRLFQFHQHDFSLQGSDGSGDKPVHGLSWMGIALGLSLHTLIDGVALGAAVLGASSSATVGLLGFGVFLAIVLHKPLDAMSLTMVMAAGGWGRSARFSVNVLFAMLCPLGALLFFFGVGALEVDSEPIVGSTLAFAAGAFICIALSDLLPEVHFHSHDRGKLVLALFAGMALAWSIGAVEPEGSHRAPPDRVDYHQVEDGHF